MTEPTSPLRALPGAAAGRPRVAEFFAGIGLARLGLDAAGLDVAWANDFDPQKTLLYTHQHGGDHYVEQDIATVGGDDLPDVELAWSSFPCTDLSLAGNRRGLNNGSQSSTFWHFTRVLEEMGERRPPVVALENVVGFATSHGGDDLAQAITELNRLGYSVDVLALDARRFVPQSRPRIFLVAALAAPADTADTGSELRPDWLQTPFGDPSLRTHRAALPAPPPPLTEGFGTLADRRGDWWDDDRTAAFVDSLSPLQAARLAQLQSARSISYRTAYRRTRQGRARWEVRADDIAGCLRTARGGSSKQAVVRTGRGRTRVRWMSAGEYARLMGAGDFDLTPARDSQALFGFGDAVCVPVVSWLAEHYLLPLLRGELAGAAPLEAVGGR
ncbi:MAG: DNA (cytosine-5-)-methyltransferase [Aeromicrobium sp.]|uniref:DNA cytosine methyltransferase n=1 Tax=Aeromicrobium sp. TaxID=1871063 RepID=UPI0039E3E733